MQPLWKLEKTKFQNESPRIWTLNLENWLMIDWHINPLSYHSSIKIKLIFNLTGIFINCDCGIQQLCLQVQIGYFWTFSFHFVLVEKCTIPIYFMHCSIRPEILAINLAIFIEKAPTKKCFSESKSLIQLNLLKL